MQEVEHERFGGKSHSGKLFLAKSQRGGLVEHPFDTLKHCAGLHFLMRGLEKCRGEFNLMALFYNFTRVLNLLGVSAFRDYCAQ